MSTNFPTSLDTLTNPTSSDKLNSPDHAAQHASENDAIEALEAKVGVNNSAVTTSLDYIIKNAASNGGGHVQTANKGGTGQTSYTKGDLLVAQSASVLTKLAVGTDGQYLRATSSVAAGVEWRALAETPTIRTYDSGGSNNAAATSLIAIWYKPSTISYAIVEVEGGGGGGGARVGGGSSGAGGGGAYSRKVVAAADLPLAASVIAGLGRVTASVGGTAYFGSVLSAPGGATGSGASGGAGGIATGGDVNFSGFAGQTGNAGTTLNRAPVGGHSFLGPNQGHGGDGGQDSNGAGGNDGIIVITEY